jgi:acyl-CoA thioester hydrolase
MPLQHKIEFHHDVFNEKEEHLATAKITLYFVEAGTMKKTVMPKQLQEKLQAYFP